MAVSKSSMSAPAEAESSGMRIGAVLVAAKCASLNQKDSASL